MRFRYLKNLAAYADLYEDDKSKKDESSKPQDRYFEVLEVTKQICDLAPKYEPKKFKIVIEALKQVEQLIRTNGIEEQMVEYLDPSSYLVTKKQLVSLIDDENVNSQNDLLMHPNWQS